MKNRRIGNQESASERVVKVSCYFQFIAGVACVSTIMFGLTGCGGGYYWKEQAVQPDGQSIEVTRLNKLGSKFDREIDAWSGPPPVVGYAVWIPLPAGGTVKWEGNRDLIPMAVHTQGGVVYLAASPWNCHAYVRSGASGPPYVFFRFESGIWQRVSAQEFPATIERANLLVTQGPDAIKAIETGFIAADVVHKLNRQLEVDQITIKRIGPWLLWAECFEEIKRGNYQNLR